MKQLLYLFIFWGIFVPVDFLTIDASGYPLPVRTVQMSENSITPMEALDLIQKRYAINFEKIYVMNSKEKYYYKDARSDLYLAYEGEVGKKKDYLIHLYEFIVDDSITGIGHTYTYGWYTVDRKTGVITEQIEYK